MRERERLVSIHSSSNVGNRGAGTYILATAEAALYGTGVAARVVVRQSASCTVASVCEATLVLVSRAVVGVRSRVTGGRSGGRGTAASRAAATTATAAAARSTTSATVADTRELVDGQTATAAADFALSAGARLCAASGLGGEADLGAGTTPTLVRVLGTSKVETSSAAGSDALLVGVGHVALSLEGGQEALVDIVGEAAKVGSSADLGHRRGDALVGLVDLDVVGSTTCLRVRSAARQVAPVVARLLEVGARRTVGAAILEADVGALRCREGDG